MRHGNEQGGHLSYETLAEYLEAPAAGSQHAVRRHLAGCGECRRTAQALWQLRRLLQEHPQALADASALAGDASAEALIDGALAGTLDDAQRSRLHADPTMLRAALYQALDAAEARRLQPSPDAASRRHGTLPRLLAWLQRPVPAWAAAGMAALAVLAVVGLGPGGALLPSRDAQLVAYQDDPVVRFGRGEQLPGIGFFSNAQTSSEPFAGVALRFDGRGLELRWPAVAGASAYTVQLYGIEQGRQTPLARVEVGAPQARFKDLALVPQQRYVWVISGRTRDERSFATSGGFIVSR